MNLRLERPIVFIDTETTGLNFRIDRIIDIALTKVHPDEREETKNILINPGMPIPGEATSIHGITNEDVAGKPTFDHYAKEIIGFLKDCDLAGFNIDSFDIPLLKEKLNRAGLILEMNGIRTLDVKSLYHFLDPRDLPSAHRKYCKKELEGAHRSENDVKATIAVLNAQLDIHSSLPKTVKELSECYDKRNPHGIDTDGKFVWAGGVPCVNFGKKHNGKPIKEVYETDADFFSWMLTKDFKQDAKKIAEDAFNGKFPQRIVPND